MTATVPTVPVPLSDLRDRYPAEAIRVSVVLRDGEDHTGPFLLRKAVEHYNGSWDLTLADAGRVRTMHLPAALAAHGVIVHAAGGIR